MQRGFDHFYGTIIGAGSFYHPNTLTRGNDNIEHEAEKDPSFFYTDAISDQAAAFIREHKADKARRAVLPVCRLHRAALAAACPRRGHRQVQGPLRRGLGQAARGAPQAPGRRRHHPSELAADRPRPDPAAVDRRRAARMDAALHGGLRRPDRPHGPGHRPHPQGAGRDRPDRQHADHLPVRQRRLRRGHSGRRDGEGTGRPAHDREGKDARRQAGALRQRSDPDARRRRYLPELRHGLGQPLQHAVPPLQALDPRRRHRDAVHRALAARASRREADCGTIRASSPT